MKKIHLLLLAPLLIVACQSKPTADSSAEKSDTVLNLPYALKVDRKWEINPDQGNLQTALSAMKAFEKADSNAMKNILGDTVQVFYEGGEFKGKKSDFLQAVMHEAGMYKNLQISMDDWESVISKDKSEEWVSLWYKQKWQNEKGKTDSLQMYNDIQLKNGKLIKWVDYSRHYAPQAK
ncbi:hypothetical protein [Mucilaginibacter aquariorum]|uniref:Nuclear transport factor 2 family protein n=1 Tax=Mucilaginibacter aquariorum TaxID=2967225 RepID=A0ABT1T1H0_9SPHI|nr:hypothetical protein [Mucilaginibacter aquariorum]MCQ6958457.1 hypothetical protein [Mucilaginibacter aquariorum]